MAIGIKWDEKFEIGHERIDFEHRIFVGLIRDLSLEHDANPHGPRGERILRELYKYAEFHFVSEENIMADVGYPDLAEHQRSHQIILAELQNRTHQLLAGQATADGIVAFLYQWFALHTTTEDKRIASFIQNAA